jgi:hypothetical protein
VGDVLVARVRYADSARGQPLHYDVTASSAVMHIYGAIENHKDLASVVDVPHIWFVGPMQAYGRFIDLGKVDRLPRTPCGVCAGVNEAHKNLLA